MSDGIGGVRSVAQAGAFGPIEVAPGVELSRDESGAHVMRFAPGVMACVFALRRPESDLHSLQAWCLFVDRVRFEELLFVERFLGELTQREVRRLMIDSTIKDGLSGV